MAQQFNSELVGEMKKSNNVMEKVRAHTLKSTFPRPTFLTPSQPSSPPRQDGIMFHLAKDFGFCWGVERSIELAYR